MLFSTMMNSIAFINIEVDPVSRRILDIGSVKGNGYSFHSNAIDKSIEFLKGKQFICWHNILNHDLWCKGMTNTDLM